MGLFYSRRASECIKAYDYWIFSLMHVSACLRADCSESVRWARSSGATQLVAAICMLSVSDGSATNGWLGPTIRYVLKCVYERQGQVRRQCMSVGWPSPKLTRSTVCACTPATTAYKQSGDNWRRRQKKSNGDDGMSYVECNEPGLQQQRQRVIDDGASTTNTEQSRLSRSAAQGPQADAGILQCVHTSRQNTWRRWVERLK